MSPGTDPLARVLVFLRQAKRACTAADVKLALAVAGARRAEVDAEWPRVHKRLRRHPHVLVEGARR
jgi:hypothetical protein